MTDRQERRRAVIYCRISNDKEGQEKGVQRQEDDCLELAERRGYEVLRVYTDNDTSASTRSKKARPEYQKMLERARNREFAVILAYSNSRLTRRPKEWLDLIDLFNEHGVRVETVVSGAHDLSTADGRATAVTIAAWDAAEAERTAERVKRAGLQRAKEGNWHGGHPPQGYLVEKYEDAGKVRHRLVIDELRAPLMRDAADRVIAQESLYSIAWTLNGTGITTNRGGFWRPSTIRRGLQSPYIAGLRRVPIHDEDGRVVDHNLVPGTWMPILEVEKWEEVRRVLGREGRQFHPADGSYEGTRALGGLVFCAHVDNETRKPCGTKLYSHSRRPRRGAEMRTRLVCSEMAAGGCGLVTIDYQHLEEWVLDLVWERIESPEFEERLAKSQPDESPDIEPLLLELQVLQARWDRLGDALENGTMDADEVKHRRGLITDARKGVNQKLDAIRADSARQGIESVADARALWDSGDLQRQRRFLAWMIERIEVDTWPINAETGKLYPSRLTRFSSATVAAKQGREVETEEAFHERQRAWRREMLMKRARIEWAR